MPLVPRFQRVWWWRRLTVVTAAAIVIGFPTLAVAGAPTASPTPSGCAGDCDNMGQVTVDEILELVNIALGLDATSACVAGDANRDGLITVDEILKAVNLALTRCPLVGSDAGEAATGVDESTRDGVDSVNRVVGFGKAGTGGGSVAAAFQHAGPDTGAGGGVAFPSCPAGGNVAITSCESASRTSTLTAVLSECREVDPQTQASTIRSGTLKLTVGDANVCTTGLIPPEVPVASEFTQFTVVTLDATGQTVTHTDTLTDFFTPSRPGCSGREGTDAVEGVLSVRHSPNGADVVYTYRALVIETNAIVGGPACLVSQSINGSLTVDDRARGRRFSETVRDFVITSQTSDMLRVLTESGTLTVDCLGEAQFTTSEPLRIASAASCPIAGVLSVKLPDGTVSQTRFTPNGLMFDFNGDGRIDTQAASCADPALARCTDATSVP